MFSIGDFARLGRVSVRMLRHYDAVGLLRPAKVDSVSGYRFYSAGQLARLNRVIALKELGFALHQVKQVLDEQVTVEELRGMLRLRQAELHDRIAQDTARLTQVEARLRMIESEGFMPTDEVTLKPIPALRLAELKGTARSMEPLSIGPVVQGLYGELGAAMAQAQVGASGPATAYYEEADDGETVVVHAGLPVDVDSNAAFDFSVVRLPAVEQAATIVHRGSMDECLTTYQALARWMEDAGYRNAGPGREVTLACPEDVSGMVTEIQQPVVKA